MSERSTVENLEFFAAAPPALRRRLAESAVPVKLGAGDIFYRQGDVCEQFAVVQRGSIRVFRTIESGREITLYHVQDGEPCLVNMLCVFLGEPAMASAQIEAPTEAAVVPGSTFRQWVKDEEFVRRFVFTSMARRIVDVMTLIEEVAFRKMDTRLASLLQRRFAQSDSPAGVAMATHEDLAAELGTAREVVSRILEDFERLHIVSLSRGRLELVDPEALERRARPPGSAP